MYCLWFAAIPIFDCLTCFVRRTLIGKSPFSPGRDHFHHILLRGGFRVRQTLGILGITAGVLFFVHAIGGLYALIRPRRGFQDFLAGTYLVPR